MYYVIRLKGAWKVNFYLNLTLNWIVPFLVLLPNYFARKKFILAIVIIALIAGQYVDLFEQIMPVTMGDYKIGFVEVGTFIGFAGLFSYMFMRTLSSASLIPGKSSLFGRKSLSRRTRSNERLIDKLFTRFQKCLITVSQRLALDVI